MSNIETRSRRTHRVLGAALALGALTGASHVHAAPISTQFGLSGAVGLPRTYNLAGLQALPATTETVTFTAGGAPTTDTYTGVTMSYLLASAGGITTNPAVKNDILRKYVIATGSDGYQAVVGAAEFTANFGGRGVMVAYFDTAGPLGSSGFARMIVPGDVAGGRYVSNMTSIQIIDATVPEPATTGILLIASLGLVLARWRRASIN